MRSAHKMVLKLVSHELHAFVAYGAFAVEVLKYDCSCRKLTRGTLASQPAAAEVDAAQVRQHRNLRQWECAGKVRPGHCQLQEVAIAAPRRHKADIDTTESCPLSRVS